MCPGRWGKEDSVQRQWWPGSLVGCWLSRFLGAPSLPVERCVGSGQWVWAVPGYHIHWQLSWLLLPGGHTWDAPFQGGWGILSLGLREWVYHKWVQMHLTLGANHMQSRTIGSNLFQLSWVSWQNLAKAHFKVCLDLSTFPGRWGLQADCEVYFMPRTQTGYSLHHLKCKMLDYYNFLGILGTWI